MTKTEALKGLLKLNLEKLCYNTSINGLTIEFKSDEVIVVDKDKNVVFKDLLKNYDLDYISQKRFILNVADSVTSFVDVLEDIEDKRSYFEDLIRVDDRYYFDVVGGGDIYDTATYISVNMDKLREDCEEHCKESYKDYKAYKEKKCKECEEYDECDECEYFEIFCDECDDFEIYCDECCNDYIINEINYYIEEIKNNFEWKGVRVVLYEDDYMYNVGFYVSAEINEYETYVSFIEDSENLKYIEKIKEVEELEDLTDFDSITLYYKLMKDEKEADKAVEFIKELVA